MLKAKRSDRVDGEIGYRQILWMEEKLRKYSDKCREFFANIYS